jgi:peroxin-5
MLLRWLRARYTSLPIPEDTVKAMSTHSSWDTHNRITDLFLTLARTQHSEGNMDPEVQIGLGVLYYTNQEFDKAKDCFETALAARPKVYPGLSLKRYDPQYTPGLSVMESIRVFPFEW